MPISIIMGPLIWAGLFFSCFYQQSGASLPCLRRFCFIGWRDLSYEQAEVSRKHRHGSHYCFCNYSERFTKMAKSPFCSFRTFFIYSVQIVNDVLWISFPFGRWSAGPKPYPVSQYRCGLWKRVHRWGEQGFQRPTKTGCPDGKVSLCRRSSFWSFLE